jgi:type VI protein secretion system component Hcp
MAIDAFMKFDGINGEMQTGEIPLQSFSWGVSNSSSGANGGAGNGEGGGKTSFHDFSFTSVVGKQSPQLFESAVNGGRIVTATLTINDKVEPITLKFTEVFISSYKLTEGAIKLSEGAIKLSEGFVPAVQLGAPMEAVSFNFTKVEFNVRGKIGLG